MLIRFTLGAGKTTEFAEENDFFRVLEGTGEMTLMFYFNGKEISRAEKVKEGYAEKFLTERYNRVTIKNEATYEQSIQIVGRLGHEVEYNKTPQGDVNIKNTGGSFTHAQKGLTTANGVMANSNTNRRYLLIQNNDEAATIYVTLNGKPSTTALGIKLAPNDSLELSGYVPTGEINGISTIPTSNVLLVEG